MRLTITAEYRPAQLQFVPGTPPQDVLIWSLTVLASEGPRQLPRDLVAVTRQRSIELELSRVRDLLLSLGVRAIQSGAETNAIVLIGEPAPDALVPAWAEARDCSADVRRTWLIDHDEELPMFHSRVFLSSAETTVRLVQDGYVSKGVIIYDPLAIEVQAPDFMEVVDAEELARALLSAARLAREVAA